MRSVEQIQDPAQLRQAALLLEQENARLHARIAELLKELSQLKGGRPAEQLELELARLQEQLASMRHKMFGDKSERRAPEPEAAPAPEPKEKDKRPGHGPRVQPELPRLLQVHELDAADRTCPLCGDPLCEWEGQSEDADEITVVERHFVITTHRRKKYRCHKGCAPQTAPGPLKLVPGGRYAIDFAVHVAISKYLDHLPLERQARIFAREGLLCDSQTLWDQLFALYQHLRPCYDAIRTELFKRPLLHGDETTWKLLDGRAKKTWYVWSLCDSDAVYHRLLPGRSTVEAEKVLADYQGILMVDGYAAYQSVAAARAGPTLVLCYCWAHVRRKFIEAEKFEPACKQVLALIGQLYAIERELGAPDALTGEAQTQALAQRLAARKERSAPLVSAIQSWAVSQTARPESAFRKAIEYMLSLWPGLIRFLDNPLVPLDNNLMERQMRDVVLGRKNHYGSKSERGTEVAALFYSLIETAKLRGVDPAAYLLTAARAAIAAPGTVTLPARAG
jgi:transposase